MPDGWGLLLDLLVTLTAALLLGLVMEKLRQSAVIGYLLAGVAVGPGAAAWIRDADTVVILAELGVALLLFTIGLEFSWRRLVRLGKVAFVGGPLQVILVLILGGATAYAFGMNLKASIALGAIASLASTAVVLRLLKDHNDLDSVHGKSAIGILLAQDIAVVPLVMLLTFLGGVTPTSGKGAGGIGQTLLNASMLVGALLLLVMLVLPRILDARTVARNREFTILIAITTCMAATWGAHAAGLSPALGAFLAGMLLAESKFADQMRSDVNPLKTLFVTLFFASIGLVLDVHFFADHWLLIVGTLIPVCIGKALFTFLACKPFVPSVISCAATGIVLCQIGEFSFVLAQVAHRGSLLDEFLFQLVVAVSVTSLVLTPFVVPRASSWSRALAKRILPGRVLAGAENETKRREKLTGHVILAGYGEAGQRAAEVLGETGYRVLVMELNPHLVRQAESKGFLARVGDVSQAENLLEAHLPEAAALVITIPEPILSGGIAGLSKMLAPHVPVVVRSRYHVMAEELNVKGADFVVDEETLVGDKLGQMVGACLAKTGPAPDPIPGASAR